MTLFELGDDLPTPLEVASSAGQPVLRLRRGTPVTAGLVQELNELIGEVPLGGSGDMASPRGHTCCGATVPDTVVIVVR